MGLFFSGFSQKNVDFEVNVINPPFSLSKEKLKKVTSIIDINRFYKNSWIKEYKSVEVAAVFEGKSMKVVGKNDNFTEEQKALMNSADVNTNIEIKVHYLPENTLSRNELKDFSFKFIVNPEQEASFVGGENALRQYLKEQAIQKIPVGAFQGFDLTAVKFTIDEAGKVTDAHIAWPYENREVDDMLLSAICNMPPWTPAQYANGKKVKQELVFTVGNHENCAINTLNIREIE